MSGEPKTHTLEEAIQLLGPDEVLLVGYCGWEGMQYSVAEESSVKFLTHSYGKWEDALTDRLDRKVVARDEAAELRAENQRMRKALDAVDSFLSHEYHRNGHRLTDKEWAADVLRQVEAITRSRLAGGENEK